MQKPAKIMLGVVGGALALGIIANVSSGADTTPAPAAQDRPAATTAAPRSAAPVTTVKAIPLPPPPPPAPLAPHRALNARDWQLLAKDPDAHKGERVIVYGRVTQFDSATGTSGFRANVHGVKQEKWYDYDTNTILKGDEAKLKDVVEDDLFKAEVTVSGSYSYDTSIGGNTTAPELAVDSITITGQADS